MTAVLATSLVNNLVALGLAAVLVGYLLVTLLYPERF